MVQFKPYFMGQTEPPHTRLVSIQRCFRTTDIEEVGDPSHLTFFEMLGNFSIGDYFKAEIIPWAQEFLTQRLEIPQGRLWPAVFQDDDEAFDLWRSLGYSTERIMRYGEDDNYWFSGDVGPCGPDSEIHYDFGEEFGCGPDCHPAHGHDRFVEIWNLVFMSFYCDGDQRTPLPSNNVDTGSGLERVASVLLYETPDWDKSRIASVYDTDLFRSLIQKIEELSGKGYGEDRETDRAIRIVAEHSRAVTFLVGDERTPVTPSNEERGYVVRRMLRRAVYFGRRGLGIEGPFLGALADAAIEIMAPSYPELERQRSFVKEILAPEERRFDETLHRGLEMLEEIIAQSDRLVSGSDAFALHDTYGFPIELTREIAAEHGVAVDEAGFQEEMERQRERARASAGGAEAVAADTLYTELSPDATTFLGYDTLDAESLVNAIVATTEGLTPVDSAEAPIDVEVLLAETPFYPEGGGQVGDRGEIVGPNGRVEIMDTQRVAEKLIVHRGRLVDGQIAVGDTAAARVDPRRRADTMRNHTATHLLHAALRQVLGTHVRQKGSLVAPDHLRFDFTHTEAITAEQLEAVESLVNEKVRQNIPVSTRTTSMEQAMSEEGVLKFFGDKYGDEVRVVEVNSIVPRFSAELCGGTHCHQTGDIGMIVITGESSIGSGMRRIEALTGRGAEEYIRSDQAALSDVARKLGVPRHAVPARAEALIAELDAQRKKVERLERSIASAPAAGGLTDRIVDVDGVKVVAVPVEATSIDALRYHADAAKKSLPDGVAVFGAVIDDQPYFVAMAAEAPRSRGVHAGNLIKRVASVAGGGGGGRPDMAQGGGKDASKMGAALAVVPEAVREMLSDGSA